MIEILVMLIIITFLFWLGFKVTGALLKAFVWLVILLPIALVLWGCALMLCCTIVLIPVGTRLFGAGWNVLTMG